MSCALWLLPLSTSLSPSFPPFPTFKYLPSFISSLLSTGTLSHLLAFAHFPLFLTIFDDSSHSL